MSTFTAETFTAETHHSGAFFVRAPGRVRQYLSERWTPLASAVAAARDYELGDAAHQRECLERLAAT